MINILYNPECCFHQTSKCLPMKATGYLSICLLCKALTFLLDVEVALHGPLARGLLVLICRPNSVHQLFNFLLCAQKVVPCLHPKNKHRYAHKSEASERTV